MLRNWIVSRWNGTATGKSHRGRFLEDYAVLVDRLLKTHGRDKGLCLAVGGDDIQGDFQLSLIARAGYADGQYLIDVGCGSGRLTRRIAQLPNARYLGIDINKRLLDYARESAGRPDFRFLRVSSTSIPEEDGVADMVTFFSVGTHLLHEEFFHYLQEAKRVLKPGGCVVFSFLDLMLEGNRQLFLSRIRHAGKRLPGVHLDTFISRADIPIWAEMLDMALLQIIPGDEHREWASPSVAQWIGRKVPAFALGQSVAILHKGERET